MSELCYTNLNKALIRLAQEDEKIVFVGEDIKSPYGGAFNIESELSDLFPDRLISTPISEESITGMCVGMAIRGYKPVLDMMFSDFMALSFDMILNFASKFNDMYAHDCPLQMIIRAANGGYRGYGATHSQSMQKYFLGIPDVAVYEMSRFHDNYTVFKKMLSEGRPCIYFEEKTLYQEEIITNGDAGRFMRASSVGNDNNWVCLETGYKKADVAIICHGGIGNLCIDAAERLMIEHEKEAKIFIPSKIYPCDLSPVIEELEDIGNLVIAEESTQGANWANSLMSGLISEEDNRIRVDRIKMLSSDSAAVPSDINLEKATLISSEDIYDACLKLCWSSGLLIRKKRQLPLT